MAYTTINKSTDYFNTKLYTGNGNTDHAITGVGFQPDFFWGKKRSASGSNFLVNSISGVGKHLLSDGSGAETTFAEGVKSFDSDGVTIGTGADINDNSQTFVSWNWKANGAGSSNTDGTITSTVSVNTTAGFSIVKYLGNSSAGATVGHGLGVVPEMIIIKQTTGSTNWTVYHKGLGNFAKYLYLDSSNAEATDSGNFDNVPTSSTFLVGSNSGVNASSGSTYIAYCFAPKTGYSKFGKYYGNGNANGSFIYTGFKPRFFISKRTDGADNWSVWDSARDVRNEGGNVMEVDTNSAEWNDNNFKIDFVSNGVKIRNAWTQNNNSSGTYIYMAFGQSLVGSNNIPCTAR